MLSSLFSPRFRTASLPYGTFPLQGTLRGNPPFRSKNPYGLTTCAENVPAKKMRGHPDPTEQGPRPNEIDEEKLSRKGGAENT